MEPLFTAVIHGCRAGQQQQAYREVYRRRLQRGQEFYSTHKLGALSSELTALLGFFEHPWDRPSAHLTPANQAFILNEAGFDLRALGRLIEAVQPMQSSLEMCIAQEDWSEAAIRAGNLSELALTLGEVSRAVAFGEQSVELADRCESAFRRLSKRTTLADALHQAGRWEESAEAFREAEAMQVEWQPQYPRLYSLWGYRYCNLLLSWAEPEDGAGLAGLATSSEQARRFREACREVRERTSQTLEWAGDNKAPLLDFALDHLSLGRAHFGLALTASDTATPDVAEAEFARSAEHLERAVEGLRQAGTEHNLPWALLARAAFRRLRGDLRGAKTDLDEALEIAERGAMRLHECDAHLEWARLCLQQGDAEAARRHVGAARKIVEETGYGRRAREVGWLEGKV